MARRFGNDRKPPKLRKFNGEDDKVEDYLKEVNVLMNLQVLPAKQAALWIIDSLEGAARTLVLGKNSGDLDTPQKVMDILKEEWGDRKSHTKKRRTFYGKNQRNTESISEYATKLNQLWERCNEGVPAAERLTEDCLVNTFIDGLKTVELRRELRKAVISMTQQGQNVRLNDLIPIAKEWMKEEEEDKVASSELLIKPEVTVDAVHERYQMEKTGVELMTRQISECVRGIQSLSTQLEEGQRKISNMEKSILIGLVGPRKGLGICEPNLCPSL